jgi:hypothetical protein
MLQALNGAFRDSVMDHVRSIIHGEKITNTTELEFRVVSFDKEKGRFVQTIHQFKNIIENLQKLGLKLDETYTLDISIDDKRLTITELDDIKRYCQSENLTELPPNHLIYIRKNKRSNDVKEYNLRIGLSDETALGDPSEFNKQIVSRMNKTYRYKHRYSFYGHPKIRFDLTVVKSGDGPSFKECTSLVSAQSRVHLFKSNEEYEVEMEFTNIPTDINVEELLDPETTLLIYNVLKWSQKGFAVMKLNDKGYPIEDSTIRQEYKNLVFPGWKPAPKEGFFFIGMNVYPLRILDIDTIKHGYSVTDKADGDRCLLYISKNADYAGILYFINNQLEIKHTGLRTENKDLFGSIFDGELVLTSSDTYRYLTFDCLYLASKDVRTLPLIAFGAKGIDSKSCRYGLVVDSIQKLEPRSIANGVNMTIAHKVYEFQRNDEPDIFQLAEKVTKKTHDYKRDGLIFTPCDDRYPAAILGEAVKWTRLLKWKPLDQLSIDFLIEFTKPFPIVDKMTDIKYIEAELKINQSKGRDKGQGDIIDFVPENQPHEYDPHFNSIRLKVTDESGLPRAKDKNYIYNHSIVEFIYDEKNPKGYKWVPLRVRTDKVVSNAPFVVNSTWELIMNPVSLEMITGHAEIKSVSKVDQYYADVGEESKLVAPMREYHNSVKFFLFKRVTEHLRKIYTSQMGQQEAKRYVPIDVMDIACGQGGDLPKWSFCQLNTVLGIDSDYQNLHNPARGAFARKAGHFARIPKNKQAYPTDLYLIWGDSRKFLNNGSAGLDEGNVNLLKGMLSSRGPASFDILSCQFAFHYFTESASIISQVLYNVSYNLKIGGYFIGTTLDGSVVHEKLAEKKTISGQLDTPSGQPVTIWKITKKYTGSFKDSGQQIDVYNVSIGNEISEYLVNFNYITKMAESFGLVPIDENEITDLQARQSFREIRNKILQISPADRKSVIERMSEEEKQYSDMNNYFIFKKIRHPTKKPDLEETKAPPAEGTSDKPSKVPEPVKKTEEPKKKTSKDEKKKPSRMIDEEEEEEEDEEEEPVAKPKVKKTEAKKKPSRMIEEEEEEEPVAKPKVKKTDVKKKPSRMIEDEDEEEEEEEPVAKPKVKKTAVKKKPSRMIEDEDEEEEEEEPVAKPKVKKTAVKKKPSRMIEDEDEEEEEEPVAKPKVKKTVVKKKPSRMTEDEDEDEDDEPVRKPKGETKKLSLSIKK